MEKIKRHYKKIFVTIAILSLFIGGVVVKAGSVIEHNEDYIKLNNASTITVEILGEVKYPGKYTVKIGTTIKEVFYVVGGLLEYSDTSLINLNETLDNNDVIFVNKTKEKTNRININTATIKELTKLTGIGQKKAEAIYLYRITNGSFKTIQDLNNVDEISAQNIIDIIDEITLS